MRHSGATVNSNFFVPPPHVCDAKFCNPVNRRHGKNTFVCDYGVVHECGPGLCRLAAPTPHGEYVCPISGMVIEVAEDVTFAKNPDMQHWIVVKDSKGRGAKRPRNEKSLSQKVAQKTEEILRKLFHGTERRATIHKKRSLWLRKCEQQQTKYFQTQKSTGQYCNMQELLRINSNLAQKMFPRYAVALGDESEALLARLQQKIEQVWAKGIVPFYGDLKLYKTIQEAHSRPNLTYLTLAILYYMKNGGYCNSEGIVIIPTDSFVASHLPVEQDLENFGYALSRLKPAKDLLLCFFEQAQKNYMSIAYEEEKEKKTAVIDEPTAPPPTVFKPKVRGFYCERCKKRHDKAECMCAL